MAIYPIVPGQKDNRSQTIPPRPADGKSVGTASSTVPAPAPAEHKPAPAEADHGDLIDFGQDDSPANPPQRPVATDPRVESTGEISGLLKSTGKPSEGPLINFHSDIKGNTPSMPRSDTTASNDVFVDAKE